MEKKIKCKSCGEEINAKAEVCPKCGVKVKKPLYKKTWFIILAVIVVIAAIASSGGGDEENPSGTAGNVKTEAVETVEETVYEEYTVSQLIDDLNSNALKAENTYDGKMLS